MAILKEFNKIINDATVDGIIRCFSGEVCAHDPEYGDIWYSICSQISLNGNLIPVLEINPQFGEVEHYYGLFKVREVMRSLGRKTKGDLVHVLENWEVFYQEYLSYLSAQALGQFLNLAEIQ